MLISKSINLDFFADCNFHGLPRGRSARWRHSLPLRWSSRATNQGISSFLVIFFFGRVTLPQGFFKNGPTPASFLFIFVFSNKHYKFYNKYECEKCPSSIRHRDSNSQPSDYESPPLTTKPGLPPLPQGFRVSLNGVTRTDGDPALIYCNGKNLCSVTDLQVNL